MGTKLWFCSELVRTKSSKIAKSTVSKTISNHECPNKIVKFMGVIIGLTAPL
jgi:hypothetical protein